VGIALGRASWALFADYLGVANDPTIPVATLAALGAVTVLGAVAVALVPARIARNVTPAKVFRASKRPDPTGRPPATLYSGRITEPCSSSGKPGL